MLEDWSREIDGEQEKYLTKEGQDEMILLAERMQKRFPNAVKNKYNNQTFQVSFLSIYNLDILPVITLRSYL